MGTAKVLRALFSLLTYMGETQSGRAIEGVPRWQLHGIYAPQLLGSYTDGLCSVRSSRRVTEYSFDYADAGYQLLNYGKGIDHNL